MIDIHAKKVNNRQVLSWMLAMLEEWVQNIVLRKVTDGVSFGMRMEVQRSEKV